MDADQIDPDDELREWCATSDPIDGEQAGFKAIAAWTSARGYASCLVEKMKDGPGLSFQEAFDDISEAHADAVDCANRLRAILLSMGAKATPEAEHIHTEVARRSTTRKRAREAGER